MLTSDPGKVRSKSNNDDWRRWQIKLFRPAKVFSNIERRSWLETTLYVGAGEGETGRRLGRVGARKELWGQAYREGLRPAQDLLSQGVEERRPGATRLAKVSHCCGVVAKDSHRATLES